MSSELKKHGPGNIKDEVDNGAHLLPVQFHGVIACAGESLPVYMAWVIPGRIISMVLKVEG